MKIITLFLLSLNCLFAFASANINLASGKTATASSVELNSDYVASNAIDGNRNTRWSSEEMKPNPEWITVDLGSVMKVNKVDVLWEKAFAKEFDIQVSNDDKAYETVVHEVNKKEVILKEDLDNEEDFIQTSSEFAPKEARYVRIYCTKKGTIFGYSIYELEIYNTSKDETVSKSKDETVSKSKDETVSKSKSDKSDSDDNKIVRYAIIGGLVLLCVIILLLLLLLKRKNKTDNSNKNYLENDYVISPVKVNTIDESNNNEFSFENESRSDNIVSPSLDNSNVHLNPADIQTQTQTQNLNQNLNLNQIQNQGDIVNSTNINGFNNFSSYNYQDPMNYMQNGYVNTINRNYYDNNNINNNQNDMINSIPNNFNGNYNESLVAPQNNYRSSVVIPQNLGISQSNYNNGYYLYQNGGYLMNMNMVNNMNMNQSVPPVVNENQYNIQNPIGVNDNGHSSNVTSNNENSNNENTNNENSNNRNEGTSSHSERRFNKAVEAELDRTRNNNNDDDKLPEYSVN